MFDIEERARDTKSANPDRMNKLALMGGGAEVKTGDVQEEKEARVVKQWFRKPIEQETIHFASAQIVFRSPRQEQEFVVETAYGTVEEVFEDKVNVVLDLYGQKKVYGFSIEALRRRGVTSLQRNDAVMLQAVFRNGTIEGRLVRLGPRPEATVEKKKFPLDKEYFLEQDA